MAKRGQPENRAVTITTTHTLPPSVRLLICSWLRTQGSRRGRLNPGKLPSLPVPVHVNNLAQTLGCCPSSITRTLRKLEAEGYVRNLVPPQHRQSGGVWQLMVMPPTFVKRTYHITTAEVIYWMARRHPGEIDMERLRKELNISERQFRRALYSVRKEGLCDWQRLGSVWNIGVLRPLRRARKDAETQREQWMATPERFPEEFFKYLAEIAVRVGVRTRSSGCTMPLPTSAQGRNTSPNPPPNPPRTTTTLTTPTTNQDALDLVSTLTRAREVSAWRLDVRDTLFEMLSTARRMDPLRVLPDDPYDALYAEVAPVAAVRLGELTETGWELMAVSGNTEKAEVGRTIRSMGAQMAAKMPTATADTERKRTLYYVGSAKLKALTDMFRAHDARYAVSRADNEAVRSPMIGWHCQAWVEAYLAGEDYDPYDLEFDEKTDVQFTRYQAGLDFIAENPAVWEIFWHLVSLEVADITGKVYRAATRTIENWVYFGGDRLAEAIGHLRGAEAYLAAGQQLGTWVFLPMNEDMQGQRQALTDSQRAWVMLFAIGLAQQNAQVLNTPLREPVLLTLASLRWNGIWGLSTAMLDRLGIMEDFEALRAEARDLAAAREGRGVPDLPFGDVRAAGSMKAIYGDVDATGLPPLADFGIDPGTSEYHSRFTAEYYEGLARIAAQRGDEVARQALQAKADAIAQARATGKLSLTDSEALEQPIPEYDEDCPPQIEWFIALTGNTSSGRTTDGGEG